MVALQGVVLQGDARHRQLGEGFVKIAGKEGWNAIGEACLADGKYGNSPVGVGKDYTFYAECR